MAALSHRARNALASGPSLFLPTIVISHAQPLVPPGVLCIIEMLSASEINVLGNAVNTTWGRASTDSGEFPLGTAPMGVCSAKLVPVQGPPLDLPKDVIKRERVPGINSSDTDCHLVINYVDLVSFRADEELQAQMKRHREVAEKVVAGRVKALRTTFRKVAGRVIRLKEQQAHDSVDSAYIPTPEVSLVAVPMVRPRMYRGFYRYTAVFSVS